MSLQKDAILNNYELCHLKGLNLYEFHIACILTQECQLEWRGSVLFSVWIREQINAIQGLIDIFYEKFKKNYDYICPAFLLSKEMTMQEQFCS